MIQNILSLIITILDWLRYRAFLIKTQYRLNKYLPFKVKLLSNPDNDPLRKYYSLASSALQLYHKSRVKYAIMNVLQEFENINPYEVFMKYPDAKTRLMAINYFISKYTDIYNIYYDKRITYTSGRKLLNLNNIYLNTAYEIKNKY